MSTLGEEGTLSAYKEKTITEKFFFWKVRVSAILLKVMLLYQPVNAQLLVHDICTAQYLLFSMMPYYTCEGLKGSSDRKRGPKKNQIPKIHKVNFAKICLACSPFSWQPQISFGTPTTTTTTPAKIGIRAWLHPFWTHYMNC